METPQPNVKDIFDALVKHLVPSPLAEPSEKQERDRMRAACMAICGKPPEALKALRKVNVTWARLLDAAVSERWGCATATLRSFKPMQGARHGRRRPTKRANPRFFEDLRTYGAARFRPDGTIINASLNKGPSRDEFEEYTPAGHERSAAA